MNGLFSGLIALFQAAAAFLVGPPGVIIITVGIAGTALGCLLFHLPFSWLWKAVIISAVMLSAGAIASGLTAGGGGGIMG